MNNTFLNSLFDKLNSINIRYAVLRNYELLPKSAGGSDIDMWIHYEDCQKFFYIIKTLIIECDGELVSYIWKRHEPKICLMGPDWGIQIDIYTGLVPIGNYEFFSGNIIEKHIKEHNGVKVIDNNWCAIESLLKEILNTGSCDRKEKFYIDAAQALKNVSEQELKDGLPMFSDSYLKLLQRVSNEPKTQSLIDDIYKKGRKELSKKVKGSTFDKIKRFKRIFNRPGYMIAILGTDGAGKSAIYEAILPHLEDAFHNGVHYRHLRPHMLPDIGILLGKRKEIKGQKVCVNPHGNKSSGKVGSIVRLLYYAQDYIWGYWFKIWPHIATHADVYIMDRYYYDYYIDQTRSLTNLPKWIIKLVDCFIPKPDIILCLGGDPEKIYARKPETSLEEVKKQTIALKQFCECKKNAFWVNTTDFDINTSSKIALKGIADRMAIRFKNIKHL